MAEIKLADVAKLRKMTMAGMMDCKNALAEADGDMERAVEIIREKGKLVASKRADRNATEGVVVSRVVNGTKAYMLCLACETDFVAKTEGFVQAANEILEIAVKNDVADLESLLATKAGASLLNAVLASPEMAGRTEREVYQRITALGSMCMSVCYSSILEGKPDNIDAMKPVLYDIIRRALSPEK